MKTVIIILTLTFYSFDLFGCYRDSYTVYWGPVQSLTMIISGDSIIYKCPESHVRAIAGLSRCNGNPRIPGVNDDYSRGRVDVQMSLSQLPIVKDNSDISYVNWKLSGDISHFNEEYTANFSGVTKCRMVNPDCLSNQNNCLSTNSGIQCLCTRVQIMENNYAETSVVNAIWPIATGFSYP